MDEEQIENVGMKLNNTINDVMDSLTSRSQMY